jgi:seryl-tRNA synthetase
MRGDLLALFRAVESGIAELTAAETRDEWLVPAGIALETLARAGYFESFPQWLTLASHLRDDAGVLERVARDMDPATAAGEAAAPAEAALAPAVCYHAYAALAGTRLHDTRLLTAQASCWRHEGDRLEPLARGWAFTMRELVCVGRAEDVEAVRRRGITNAECLARSLGLDPVVAPASDPFFVPTARGRALLQRVKALKHELLLPLGDRPPIAAASFNHHERFFGEAFDIRLADGIPAESGCVAFGLERWVLAILAEHGPNRRNWPAALERTTMEVPT